MKRVLFATGAAIVLMTGHASAQALPFWEGSAVVDSVTAACANGGFVDVSSYFKSSYRPKLAANDPSSGISFVSDQSMQMYFYASGANEKMNGQGTYAMRLLRGNVTSVPNPTQTSLLSGNYNFKIAPGDVIATTDVVNIRGTITKWRGVAGCTVKFRASYRASPGN